MKPFTLSLFATAAFAMLGKDDSGDGKRDF